jgi:hypothetical protein
MYRKVNQNKAVKTFMLKLFISQQKNKAVLITEVRQSLVPLLIVLWRLGYISGFIYNTCTTYTIILKKQFKYFNVNFFNLKLTRKKLRKFISSPLIKTGVIVNNKGVSSSYLSTQIIGGILLFDIL